jgi:hypothetical protein
VPKRRRSNGSNQAIRSNTAGQAEIARLTGEFNVALERQAATTDVLHAISVQSQKLDEIFVAWNADLQTN